MLKRHSQLFEGLFTASDLLIISVAWVFSYWARFSWGIIPVEKGVPPSSDYLRMLIFVWLIWAFVFRKFGLYLPMRSTQRFREIWKVIKANSLSVVLLLAVTYLFREKSAPFSRLVFVIFWGLSTICAVGSRSLIRGVLREMRRRGYNVRYVLIVGSGELASKVASRLQAHPEFGMVVVGCLQNKESEAESMAQSAVIRNGVYMSAGGACMPIGGYVSQDADFDCDWKDEALPINTGIIGNYEDLPRILDQGGIDQVIVALPFSDQDCMASVLSSVSDAMVDVRIVPDFHRFVQLGSQVEEFDGLPVISIASTPLVGLNRVQKRIFDIIVTSLALVIAVPLALLFAVLVKLTSRGPVFYSQERVGLDGKRFSIYKLRTMYESAEDGGARFAVKDDPRVTPIGRFMRRYNVDELPQLFNVIRGQMSLVGPRPERPVFIEEFRRHFPRYMLRHKVQAGITGWAQVNGWRGNTSIERRIEHDLYYIEHWSLVLDLKILYLTLLNSFRDRNAY